MAFGQTLLSIIDSWGVSPGYGEERPAAKIRAWRKTFSPE
jgi:hypothetical protein